MPLDNTFNNDEVTVDNFFDIEEDTPIVQNSDAYDARQAGMGALVDQTIDDTPIDLGYPLRRGQAQDDPSHETMRRDLATKATGESKDDLDALIENFFSDGNTQEGVEGMQVVGEAKTALDDKVETSSIEESFVSTLDYSIDSKRREQALFKLEVGRDIVKLLDEQGITDKIVNYSGLLLSDMTLDLSRVVGSDYLSTPDSVVDFIDKWHGLDVDTKRRLFPTLKAAIHEATDENNVKTAIHLLRFIDPELADEVRSELTFDQILFGFDVATLGLSILTKLGKAAKASNIIKASKTIEREDEAAKLNVMSMLDETGQASNATKTDEVTAQANGAPFKMEDIMPEATDGINVETQSILKLIQQGRNATQSRLEELINGEAFIKETAFTRVQKERIQAKAVLELEKLKEDVFQSYGWDISDIKIISPSDVLPKATAETTKVKLRALNDFKKATKKDRVRLKEEAQDAFDAGDTAQGNKLLDELDEIKQETTRLDDEVNLDIAERQEFAKLQKVSDEDAFVLQYTYEGVPTVKTINYNFKLSDIGTFDQLATGAVEKGLTSPSFYLKGLSERFVEGATNIELASAKVLDIFNRTVNDIMSGTIGSPVLHRKAYKELDDVLLTGDDFLNVDGTSGKLYKLDELRSGVDTGAGTVRLNDKQIVAYYRLRDLFDNVGVLKNNELRRTLELNGMKNIAFEGTNVMGKPFERLHDGLNSMRKRNNNVIYDPSANKGEGGIVNITEVDMADMYAKNFRIVRMMENEVVGNQHVTHALVKTTGVTDLPLQVMHLKKGYVPKVYKEGFYFVKKELTGILNGRTDSVIGLKTMRMFNSRKGADNYIASLQVDEPSTVFKVLHDREMTQAKLADEGVGISGGLYTSARSKRQVLFNEEGITPPRLSAFESLQRNLNHLSNYLPRNEWRIGMQQKWINTAREQKMLDGTDFNAALMGEKHTPEWNALNSAREYIKDQMRIPTSEERWFEAKTRALAEWAEAPISLGKNQITSQRLPEFARKSLQTFAHTDPFALARSTAFHSLLGWFNPAQLFVQAQGASIAMSLYPEHAVGAFRRYTALRPLMHLTSSNADMVTARKLSDKIAKTSKIAPDELWEDYMAWRKSGLQESIKATADYSASSQNFGFGLNAIKSVADKGLVFYREGEMFTRGIAFSIAKDVWRKANKGKKIVSEDMKDILDHAMKMQLNLTRANRAAWQKGALSIPTQFLQIQTKFIEKAWPSFLGGKSELTGTQKAKLMFMQFGIYGAAGVPFGNWLVNEGTQFTGQTPEEMNPATKRYLSGGVWDLMFFSVFNADVEVGRRGAVVSGIEDLFKSLIYEKAPLMDTVFGAFGEIPSRAFQSMKQLAPLVSDPMNITYTPEEFEMAARSLASIISTWRNIDKAILLSREGLARDKQGNIVVDKNAVGGFSAGEVFMKAMGFQLKDIKGVYDLTQLNRHWEEHINTRVSAVVSLQNWYLENVGHEAAGQNFKIMQHRMLADLSDYDRERVFELVNKRISNPQTKEERALDKYFKHVAGETVRLNPYFGGPFTNTVIPEVSEEEE